MIISMATSFCIISCTSGKTDKGSNADSLETRESSNSSGTAENKDSGVVEPSAKINEVSAQWLLVPGVSAGQTKINSNKADLIKRLGKPDGGDAAMGKSVAVWYAGHDTKARSISIYSTTKMGVDDVAKVKQIRVTSPEFKTREGLHPSSSLSDIEEVYTVRKIETYEDAGTRYSVYDSDKGIAFEIAPDSKCAAVIIHEAGASDKSTYLKFRTTGK